ITLSPESDRMIETFAGELEPKLKEEYSDISDWAGKLIGNTVNFQINIGKFIKLQQVNFTIN
ncbi:MAG: hypothetical protein KBA11_09845, partial [Sedimentibacter sp.]|nr:hypothetical protein [Sedimentibacter sp.]